jgi:hypothetical protein
VSKQPGNTDMNKTNKRNPIIIYPSDFATLTCGQVAKMTGVAPRTIAKQFDAGYIRGYRIPALGTGGSERGEGDRRMYLDDVIKYMHNIGMRIDPRLDDSADVVGYMLPETVRHERIKTFERSMEFGIYLGQSCQCRVAIVGTEMGVSAMVEAIDLVKQYQPIATTVALFHESELAQFKQYSASDLKYVTPCDTMAVLSNALDFIRGDFDLINKERERRKAENELRRNKRKYGRTKQRKADPNAETVE